MGLSMKVLKNTDEDRGLKLKFQCPGYIYIYLAMFLSIVSVRKNQPKMAVVSL